MVQRSSPNSGPQPFEHAERVQRAEQIAAAFQRRYAQRVKGIAVYGSLARATDGPFSDIEMFVILEGERVERVFEWSAGPWKAEVDVYSEDVYLNAAGEFDEFWPITHGAFLHQLVLHDPGGLFARGGQIALGHSDEEFRALISEVIVGDLYEAVGKIRNGVARGRGEVIAPFCVDAARYGACLVGLHNRQVYTSGASLFSESLELPGRPRGYDALARLVMAGDLGDPERAAGLLDAFWEGVEDWAAEQGIPLTHDLEDLLEEGDL
ncbi:MAG TPA: kanamycin nucleotidyltransferase C-terminal domain-containing protein [Anaerolinea sp.]|nr:kanamycin nucleotidyltransferase C-terminal domain-containing protein [Anaerolinea sp.]